MKAVFRTLILLFTRRSVCAGVLFAGLAFSAQAQSTDEQLAAQYFQQGDYERAILYYEKLYKKSPTAFYYEQLFKSNMALKKFENAEKLAKEQVRKNDNEPRFLIDLGAVHKQMGQEDKSRQEFEKALKNMKPDQNSVRATAGAFQKHNETDLALQAYERGQKMIKQPGVNFHYEIANLHAEKGDLQAMIADYMDLLEENPAYLQAVQNGLARYIDFTRSDARTDALRTELLRHIQKDPQNTIFQEMLIWQYLQQKDLEGAFVQSKAMDKRFNEGGQRLMELAEVAVTNKAWTMATKCYQYVLDQSGEGAQKANARIGLVDALNARVTGQADPPKAELDELKAQYERTLTDMGKMPSTARLIAGLAHLQAYYLNDRMGAAALYQEVIDMPSLDPKRQAQYKLDLGDVLLLDGNIWEASLLYSQVDLDFKQDIIGHEARLRNAKVSFYAGDFLWAKAQLDILKASTSKLIANDAMELSLLITDNIGEDTLNTPLSLFARAQLLRFQHRFEETLTTLDSVNTLFPLNSLGDDILYERFRVAYARQQYDTAATFLVKVLEQFPNDILVDNALMDLGKLYEDHLNDKEKAKGYYEKLLFEQSGSIFVPEAREHFRKLRGDHDDLDTPEKQFLNGTP
jgi:tetratricopeptide (TPR) repeat protein